jgi:hypothetical protein
MTDPYRVSCEIWAVEDATKPFTVKYSKGAPEAAGGNEQ